MRVRLNPEDLWRMARYLKFTHTEQLFLEGYVHWRPGPGSFRAPFIRFRKTPFRFCPFLENRLSDNGRIQGLCRLHPDFKPLVCALAPAGRGFNAETGTSRYYYLPPHEGCPGHDKGLSFPLSEMIAPFRDRLEREEALYRELDKLKLVIDGKKVRELYLFRTDRPFNECWPPVSAANGSADDHKHRE